MSDRILKLMNDTRASHESRYKDDPSELVPMYFLYRGDVVVTVAVTPLSGAPGEKEAVTQKIREIALKNDCDAYTFSSEGWTLSSEDSKTHMGGSLQNHPRRLEILSVEAGTAAGEHGVLVADIVRDADSDAVTLAWREPLLSGAGQTLSRFNIFSPATDEMMDAARLKSRLQSLLN